MKNRDFRFAFRVCFLEIMFAILITNCQMSPETAAMETDTPLTTASATTTRTPTSTSSPTQTVTPIKTNTPLSSSTWTPWPTLSQEETMEWVQAVLTGDEICRLPCWGSIVPGETSEEEAKAYFKAFAQQVYIDPDGNYIFPKFSYPNYPGNTFGAALNIDRRTKLINFIETFRDGYRLDQLLRNYGPPAEIWISAEWDIYAPAPFKLMYSIILFYTDQGFLAIYRGDGEIDSIL